MICTSSALWAPDDGTQSRAQFLPSFTPSIPYSQPATLTLIQNSELLWSPKGREFGKHPEVTSLAWHWYFMRAGTMGGFSNQVRGWHTCASTGVWAGLGWKNVWAPMRKDGSWAPVRPCLWSLPEIVETLSGKGLRP